MDVVAPRKPLTVDAAASCLLPFRFGGQARGAAQLFRQPPAVRDGIVVPDEDDRVAAVAGRRLAALPHITRRQLREHDVPAAGGDEGEAADRRRWMTGGAHETGVLVLGHGRAADEEFADIHTMDRALVL